MAERRELGFPKGGVYNLRQQEARITLRKVRLEGHISVEVREDGNNFIFFCIWCRAPCYSDSALFDHLKGNLHKERYAAAKLTLLGLNPWPFNDGVLFIYNCFEEDKQLSGSSLIVVNSGKNSNGNDNVALERVGDNENLDSHKCATVTNDKSLNGENCNMVIPGVLCKDVISSLEVRFIGFGEIAARIHESMEIPKKINRIWCAWLGKYGDSSFHEDASKLTGHDFGIVTFSYNYTLGRRTLDDLNPLLSSSSSLEIDNGEGKRRKQRKKSFSDPEDISKSLVLGQYGDESRHAISRRRRGLRHQQRVASERICDICKHKILPEKDVSTLLNMKTGRLACSSRNVNGAFHLFHTSCLIHWILLCDFEIWTNQLDNSKGTHGSKRKNVSKRSEILMNDKKRITKPQFSSVICPECQGSGINVEDGQLEEPTIPPFEIFNYNIKANEACLAWMKDPEILQNRSTGLRFPYNPEETIQEKVLPLKLLHFYRADE